MIGSPVISSKPLSMKRNMVWNTAGSMTSLVCQWLITVLVVRIAGGYEAAGVYSLAVSVFGIFAPVAQYRMYTYQISDTRGENTMGEYFTFRLLTDGLALVGCFVYSLFTCSIDAVPTIMIFGVYKCVSLLLDVLHACEQRHRRMDYLGISMMLQGVSSLGIFALVFWLTKNLNITLVAMTAAYIVIAVAYDLPRSQQFEKLKLGIPISKAWHLLTYCAPIVVGALLVAAASSVPRQYLAFDMGEAALGIYASVAAPVAVVQNGASYVYYPLIGYFADYYAERNYKKLLGLFARVTGGITLVGVVCAILLELFGVPLLELFFANNIAEYACLLTPMIISAVIAAYLWFLSDLLIAIRDFRGNFIGNAASLVVAVACMVPFVAAWGMNGVSFTVAASSLAGAVAMALSFVLKLRSSKADEPSEGAA